jgi:hypothetical protein
VQMFEDNKATGEWFKVQLKSSENTNYSVLGHFLSETLTAKHAVHYSTQINDPIFLIHADVKSKRTFWFAPQLDLPVKKDDSRTSVTIRIDTRNELPQTLPAMIAALRQIRIKLGARTVVNSRITDFVKTVEDADQEQLIEEFQNKTDVLRLKQIHNLASTGNFEEATSKAEGIIGNGESSVESKFSALFEVERIELLASVGAPQSRLSETHLRTSKRMHQITRNGPPALKFFSLIAMKAGELDVATFRDFGLHMNLIGHIRAGDPSIALQLAIERLRSTHGIVKKYNQCLRIARCAMNSKHRWALPIALLRVVESIVMFIGRLRIDGQVDAAKDYRESALELCRMAVWIAERNEDDEPMSHAVTTAMLLAHGHDKQVDEILKFAHETLGKIKDRNQQEATNQALGRAIRRLAGEKVEGDPDPDPLKQIVENRATGLGINMTDPGDTMVKLIRLGIRDANPERVIKHCEHAFVSIGGNVSPVAATLAHLLQLPSIQSKIIHCDLYDYATEGANLDDLFENFRCKYCDECNDIKPRPSAWKYSDEWQEEENTRHVEFMAKFYQRHRET